jgi:hypothetical protein
LEEVQKGLSGSDKEVKQKTANLKYINGNDINMAVSVAEGAVAPINKVIKSFANVAEIEHSDPEGYIAKQLVQMGYAPSAGRTSPLIDAMRKAYPSTSAEPIEPKKVKTESAKLPQVESYDKSPAENVSPGRASGEAEPAVANSAIKSPKKDETERAPTSPASVLPKEDQDEYDRLREKSMRNGYLMDEDASKYQALLKKIKNGRGR